MRSFPRVLGWVCAAVLGLPAALLLGALDLLRWPAVQESARRGVVHLVRRELPGLEVGLLRVDPRGEVLVGQARLRDLEGGEAIRLEAGWVRVDLAALLRRELRVERAVLIGPSLLLARGRDGRLNVQRLLRPREPTPPGPPGRWRLRVDDLLLVGAAADLRAAGIPVQVRNAGLEARGSLAAGSASLRLPWLEARGRLGGKRVSVRVAGAGELRPRWIDATVQVASTGLLPGGPVQAELSLRGPSAFAALEGSVRAARAGSVRLSGRAGLPARYDLQLTLDDLRLRALLPDLPVGPLRGRVALSGRGVPLSPRASARVAVRLGPARAAGVPISRLAVDGRVRGRDWRADGQIRLPGLKLALEGRGRGATSLALGVDGELLRAERLPRRLGGLRGAGRFRVRLAGRPARLAGELRLDLARLAGRGWSSRDVKVAARFHDVARLRGSLQAGAAGFTVGRAPEYQGVTLRASGGPAALSLLAAGRGRGVRADLSARIERRRRGWRGELKRLELVHPRLAVKLRSPAILTYSERKGVRLEPARVALLGGEVTASGAWRPGREPAGELSVLARGVRVGKAGPLSLDLRGALHRRTLQAELNARVDEGRGELHLRGRIALRRDLRPAGGAPIELAVRGAHLDVALLGAKGVTGRLSFSASLSGSLDDPRLQARAAVDGGEAVGLGKLALSSELRIDEAESKLQLRVRRDGREVADLDARIEARASQLSAVLRGEEPPPDAPLHLALRAPDLDLALLRPVVGEGPRLPEGRVRASLTVEGSLHRPRANLAFSARGLGYGPYRPDALDGELNLEAAETTRLAGELRLRSGPLLNFGLEARSELAALLGGGGRDSRVSGRLTIPGFWLGGLSAIRPGLRGFAGLLQTEVRLEGTVARPDLRASLEIDDAQLGGPRLEQVRASAAYSSGTLQARVELKQAGGGALEAEAEAPLTDEARGPLRGRLAARALDLEQLRGLIPSLRELGGRLTARLTVGGSLDAPEPAGELKVEKGRLGLIGTPTLDGISLRLKLGSGRLSLEELRVPVGAGTFSASGKAELRGVWPQRLEVDGTAEKLPLELLGVTNAGLDGKLRLRASLDPRAGIRGELSLDGGRVKLAGLPGSTRRLHSAGPLGDVHFISDLDEVPMPLPPVAAKRRGRTLRAPAFPVDLKLTARSLFVRGKEMDIEVTGDLSLRSEQRDLVLVGEVRATGGWVEVLKRRYDVEQALVRFRGGPQIDPGLALAITRRFPDAQVHVRVNGTARDPDLELSSDPPIYDRSQIIALILTGQPTLSTEGGGGSSLGVASMILQVVVGRLADMIAPGVGLDVLRVGEVTVGDQQGLAAEKATELEVGKYVTDRIYLGYRRLFGAPQGENSNEGKVELRISPTWSLESVFGDAGVGALDVFWTHLY